MRAFRTITNDAVPLLDFRSIELRRSILMMLNSSRRGHLASAFSLVEILRVLYDDILEYDPLNAKYQSRDRCILSKGHGCLALYAVLADKGFFPKSELSKFCQKGGLLGGHPEITIPGVEASTGSLGHGFSIGIGMALNERYENAGYRTFVILGDGESNEGSVWEAAMCAAKHRLNKITVIVDYNKYQSYGSTREVQELEPFMDKWKSFGFSVAEVDGHSPVSLQSLFNRLPFEPEKPSAVICHTIKGRGIPFVENNLSWHHKSNISDDEIALLFDSLENG